MDVKGKSVIVTGAARGIGLGIARVLAGAGARVLLADRLTDAVEAAAAELRMAGGEVHAWAGDISQPAANFEMVQGAVRRFSKLDALVACAAASRRGPFLEVSEEDLEFTLRPSLFGAFYSCQAAARQLVEQGGGGSLLIISSVHVLQHNPYASSYNMAKAAVSSLSRTLASELSQYRIRVNAILPGWTDTPGELNFASREQLDQAGKEIPLGRLGVPEDTGHAALYLLSDEASYVTGCELLVDGGLSLTMRAAKSS
jgi:NAD(P)-dependent dehydrogenase (short-subunit alcohol dehydrogenase family)